MAAAHHILTYSKPSSILFHHYSENTFISISSFSAFLYRCYKSTQTLATSSSLLEYGGVQICKQDVVKDEPTNYVPDLIFTKLGLQLHRRDHHPLGILKNAIYEYFDTNYNNQFHKP